MTTHKKENKYLKPILGASAGGTLGAVLGRTAGSIASIPFYALGNKIGSQSAKRLIAKGTIGGSLVGTGIGIAGGIASNKYLNKAKEQQSNKKK